ncbi:histidine phosphatase superfamily branch 1 protein [Nitzschia inconspicua]|uniref:Histidine phosphatase superfamily branch 1 protein n=1 Tax=Nitzschia inconspicua TaxID=303405 RepID=A0A9K3QA06_9STRA|nr:histidine phosphatase superfamily branch 1 protein [Nitzschia inconspicua]
MKKILVFVVRHGEREDEATMMHSSYNTAYRKMSKQDRNDPKLTPEGHGQAFKAFENVLSVMEVSQVKKVAVFSSPLRRSVGTVMMLATAASALKSSREGVEDQVSGQTSASSKIQFVLPASPLDTTNPNEQQFDDPHRPTAYRLWFTTAYATVQRWWHDSVGVAI